MKDYSQIIAFAKEQYTQDINGLHGFEHWQRVYTNGHHLAKAEGANLRLVGLFAFLHDCKRENESRDPKHGLRSSNYIKTIDLSILGLSQRERDTLCYACEYHDKGMTSEDINVGCCWDSDRLDLMRVGIYPDTDYLSTKTARLQETIDLCVEQTLTWE